MSRVTPWAPKALASALVAVAAVAVVPSAARADDTTAPTPSAAPTIAERAAEVMSAQGLTPTVEQPAPATPTRILPDFTSRTLAAIRATRSASVFRWGTPSYAKWYAKSHIANQYNWGPTQFGCLISLWKRESNWNYLSVNHRGRTYGIPQNKLSNISEFGIGLTTYMATPELQVQIGAKYIKYRYGNPCAAYAHSKRVGWY